MAGNGRQGCRGAERGQTCTWDRTVDVPHTAALESAVQLGQGNEVNKQAEIANPIATKCMDSLRHACTVTRSRCMQRYRLNGIIRSCRTTRALRLQKLLPFTHCTMLSKSSPPIPITKPCTVCGCTGHVICTCGQPIKRAYCALKLQCVRWQNGESVGQSPFM
jgi:hypothetical protein